MKSKLNPISVGSFVICGMALVIVSLIFFRSTFFINKPLRFISYFNESVQGLDVGSSVKLCGVAVGHVVTIHVQYDWHTMQSRVAVLCELDKNTIIDTAGNKIQISDLSVLNQLIKNGLCAKIDLVGITGLQFVQLHFVNSQKQLENTPLSASSYPMIPTVNSGMSELTDDLVTIARNVRNIDFVKISTEITKASEELSVLIQSVTKETKDLQLKQLTTQITGAATAIEQLADYLKKHPSSLIFGRPSSSGRKNK